MRYMELPFGINMLHIFNRDLNNNNSLQLQSSSYMCFIFINSYDSHNSPMR